MTVYISKSDAVVEWPGRRVELKKDDLVALAVDQDELIAVHAEAGKGRRIVFEQEAGLKAAKSHLTPYKGGSK